MGSGQSEILEIVGADLNGFEWRHVAAILLDKDMLGAGLACMSENLLPIDAALADGHERIGAVIRGIVRRASLVTLLEVFDVEQREAAGIPLEVRHRIDARIGGPEHVHFHFQQLRIAPRQHDVVAAGVIRAGKFAEMRVVAELHSGGKGKCSALIEQGRPALPGVGAELRVIPHYQIVQPIILTQVDGFLPLVGRLWSLEVAARSG